MAFNDIGPQYVVCWNSASPVPLLHVQAIEVFEVFSAEPDMAMLSMSRDELSVEMNTIHPNIPILPEMDNYIERVFIAPAFVQAVCFEALF